MKKNKCVARFLLFCSLAISVSCQNQGTSTGNPLVELRFGSYSTASNKVEILSVSQLIFCFKRLRFKIAGEATNPDPALDNDNIDLELGEVIISSAGTNLGSVRVPAGQYSRIEFDLEDHCSSSLSAQIYNSQIGSPFQTNQRITIKFEGLLDISQDGQVIDMAIDNLITAADGVSDSSQIRSALEGVSGSF